MLKMKKVEKAIEKMAKNHPDMDWCEDDLINVGEKMSTSMEDLSRYVNHVRTSNQMILSQSEISELSIIEEEFFLLSVTLKEIIYD